MRLRYEFDIDWGELDEILSRHRLNYDKYFFWQKPDGIRFSREKIGVLKQDHINEFSFFLLDSISRIYEGEGGLVSYDAKYDNIGVFIKEFLKGKCAFVPNPRTDSGEELFIKKF
jgi:hypothetical protein